MDNRTVVNLSCADEYFMRKLQFVTEGRCRHILPLSLQKAGSLVRGIYDTSGYSVLSNLKNISAADILEAAAGAAECVQSCRNILFSEKEYVLSTDTIYVSEGFERVRLVIIPSGKSESGRNVFLYFIHTLRSLTTENGRLYLNTLGNLLECENVKYEKVTGFIRQLQREINICGIK